MLDAKSNLIDTLLSPRSIAIVGASDDPRRIGGVPLAHMLNHGFGGDIWPVNANRHTVQGLKAYRDLASVPGDVEFVLVAVPAAGVPDVIRAASQKKAKTVLILSSGFAEGGEQGAQLQREAAELAHNAGIRLIGPNCMGLMNVEKKFYPTFSSVIDRDVPELGRVAVASQSGAIGTHIFAAMAQRKLGLRYLITTGNEADLTVPEVIKSYAEHDEVDTILVYLEGIRDGKLLLEGLERARINRKPVIVLKAGSSPAGALAVTSHTASLAGEDEVFDAVLLQAGAWRVRSIEEMIDLAYAAQLRLFPVGRRLGLLSVSGGGGVLMADEAHRAGLDVSPMPQSAQATLKKIMPFAATENPVDVSAQVMNDLTILPSFVEVMQSEGGYDSMIGFWSVGPSSTLIGGPLLEALKLTREKNPDRLFIQSFLSSSEITSKYEDAGFVCFPDTKRAISATRALTYFGESFSRRSQFDFTQCPLIEVPDGRLGEIEALRVLQAAGLEVIPHRLARSGDEAVQAAAAFTFPVAMKIASAEIAHKSDLGGVRLNVTEEEVRRNYGDLVSTVSRAVPEAVLEGVIVAPMMQNGIECILGGRIDPVFGPVVLFGIGGVLTEIISDTVICRAPFDQFTAFGMINSLRAINILKGARGQKPVDLERLADSVSRFSFFLASVENEVESVEINPLLTGPDGCIALDALIVRTADKNNLSRKEGE